MRDRSEIGTVMQTDARWPFKAAEVRTARPRYLNCIWKGARPTRGRPSKCSCLAGSCHGRDARARPPLDPPSCAWSSVMHRGVLLHDRIRAAPAGECRAVLADGELRSSRSITGATPTLLRKCRSPHRSCLCTDASTAASRCCSRAVSTLLPRAEVRILAVAPAPLVHLTRMLSGVSEGPPGPPRGRAPPTR